MSMDAQDMMISGSVSNCCGAPVMLGDMCSECGEHCADEGEEDQDSPAELRADYKEQQWKDEGKREFEEQLERMKDDV